MARCAICKKGIGLFAKPIKLYDEVVCKECWTKLGFSDSDKEKYKNYAAAFIARGKYECEEIIAERKRKEEAFKEYHYKVVGVTFKNENGKEIQRLLKSFLVSENDEKYDGMTNRDIKEECNFDEKYWEYSEVETNGELLITEFEGEPAIKVLAEIPDKTHIGWISKEYVSDITDMTNKHICNISISINGGNYKMLDLEDDKEIVITEKGNYGAYVTISYYVDIPVPSIND